MNITVKEKNEFTYTPQYSILEFEKSLRNMVTNYSLVENSSTVGYISPNICRFEMDDASLYTFPSDLTITVDAVGANPVTNYYKVYVYYIYVKSHDSPEIKVTTGDDTTSVMLNFTETVLTSYFGLYNIRVFKKTEFESTYNMQYYQSWAPPVDLLNNNFTPIDPINEAQLRIFNTQIDANWPSITSNGLIYFNVGLDSTQYTDFENPEDLNKDNIYEFKIKCMSNELVIIKDASVKILNKTYPYNDVSEYYSSNIDTEYYPQYPDYSIALKDNSLFFNGYDNYSNYYNVNKIHVINDVSTLTSFSIIDISANYLYSLISDNQNDRIYATENSKDYNNNRKYNLRIYSFNVFNPSDYSIVYDVSIAYIYSEYTRIRTDGIFVYGVYSIVIPPAQWYNSLKSVFFKIRISDWTLVNSIELSCSCPSDIQIYQYNNKTECYLIGKSDNIGNNKFLKIDCSTLSYQEIPINVHEDNGYGYTCVKNIDDNGGLIYATAWSTKKLYVIDTSSMTFEIFDIPFSKSPTPFLIDNYIYMCSPQTPEDEFLMLRIDTNNLNDMSNINVIHAYAGSPPIVFRANNEDFFTSFYSNWPIYYTKINKFRFIT